MPFHRGAVAKAIPHSEREPETLYLATKKHFIDPNLTKPYLTILAAKDLYLDAIGLHLK